MVEPHIHTPLTTTDGVVIFVRIGDGPLDAQVLDIGTHETSEIIGELGSYALTRAYLTEELVVGYYADWSANGPEPGPAPIPAIYRASDLHGTERWQYTAAAIGAEDCVMPLEPARSTGWLRSPDDECEVAINARSGLVVHYGDAEVIASYRDHLVVYDRERNAFISYRADNGDVDAEFSLPRQVLNTAPPTRLPRHGEVEPQELVDYSDELSYADLIAGLQTLQTLVGAEGDMRDDDRGQSWILLMNGEVLQVDKREPAVMQLSKINSGERWTLRCEQVRIGADGTRALCLGGADSGVMFDLQPGGDVSEVWRSEVPLPPENSLLYPFNTSQWILRSQGALYLLGG